MSLRRALLELLGRGAARRAERPPALRTVLAERVGVAHPEPFPDFGMMPEPPRPAPSSGAEQAGRAGALPDAGARGGGEPTPQSGRLGRRVVPAQTRGGEAREVYINPTRDDIMRLTRIPLHGRNEPWKYDMVRFIRDRDGNVFAANGYDFIHDDIALAARREGVLPKEYLFESGPNEGHGGWVNTGHLRRQGDQLIGGAPGIDESMLFPPPKPPTAGSNGVLALPLALSGGAGGLSLRELLRDRYATA